jgi:hypothetical protein
MPWIGGAIALLTIAGAIRRKGLIGGTVDTGLDAIPFLGAFKAAVEVARGRDFIPDRPTRFAKPTLVPSRRADHATRSVTLPGA